MSNSHQSDFWILVDRIEKAIFVAAALVSIFFMIVWICEIGPRQHDREATKAQLFGTFRQNCLSTKSDRDRLKEVLEDSSLIPQKTENQQYLPACLKFRDTLLDMGFEENTLH